MGAQSRSHIEWGKTLSPTLKEDFAYLVYLPSGYAEADRRYHSVYLLHGRGGQMTDWLEVHETLDDLIAKAVIPPVVAILPNAGWNSGGNYYVDSLYTGQPAGKSIETAFFRDLIPHIDVAYQTIAQPKSRVIAGYSMGGYGATRYALAHPDVFSHAIVLSPAVYTPLPPQASSTREFGAFGNGQQLFDDLRYQSLNYPCLLETFKTPLNLFIAVGDNEYKNPRPEDYLHDIDMEAHLLYNRVSRVASIAAEFRVYSGGHDWPVWRRGFTEGMQFIAPRLSTT